MRKALRVLTVIGARPQIIKAAAISRAIASMGRGRMVETILHTGQHYDANMSQVFFDELGVPRPGISLGVGGGEPGERTAHMIEGIGKVLARGEHDLVLLFGDTDSTLAGAVAAAKGHVPIAHVEAGLRSFNKAMPEEINRIVCDHCSTWLFCPTATAVENLMREGFPQNAQPRPDPDRPAVHMTGDVMYDNSMHFAKLAGDRSVILDRLGVARSEYALVTVHRNGNTDAPEPLNAIFSALLEVRRKHGIPLVMPVHPRLRKCMDSLLHASVKDAIEHDGGFHLVPPVGFLDMVDLERYARLVITDSGGVQKEAFFFGKPGVILREETEWVELLQLGQATLAGSDPERILKQVGHFLQHGVPACPPLYGDGHAAERIVDLLANAAG